MPHDPPQRGDLLTEQRLIESNAIDAVSIENALRLINTQDMRVPQVVREAIPQIAPLVAAVVDALRDGGRLIYVGTGTSGRLGVLDASEIPPTFHADPSQMVGVIAGGDAALTRSSEAREDEADGPVAEFTELGVNDRDVIVGITAGGTTPYVWGALRLAGQRGCVTGLITCVRTETLRRWQRPKLAPGTADAEQLQAATRTDLPAQVDHIIELPVGPEVITGSTRMLAGTATKLALNMLTTTTMVQLGKTWGNLMVDLRATNDKLRDRAARTLQSQCRIDRDDALGLLDRADGKVKVALVMHGRDVDAETAQQLLDEHDGKLRAILGGPR